MAKLIDNILKAEATLGVTVTEGGSYDDTELRERVEALEQKEDKDTVYDDTEIKAEIAKKQDKLTFDDAPALNSSNPVTSGGVYLAIESQRGDYVTAGKREGTTLGECATAEGSATTASGHAAHSEGTMAVASGENSHSEGNFTVATSKNQHVFGRYNVEDAENKYVEIVGNGDYSARSNARTLDWKGNQWIAGKYSQEGMPTENNDLVTKIYADNIKYIATNLMDSVKANTDALGGHTLGMSVPAGSKLTDTVYDDTEVRKLITAKQDILTFDTTPTENSTNPVTSGGVKAYVDANAGGGSSGGSSDVIQNTAWTALASGTFTSGTAAFADFDTGVTWKDLNTYKFINIIATSFSTVTNGNYFVSVVSNSPAWNRIMFATGRGSIIFLKLKDFFWTPVYVLQQGFTNCPPQVGYYNAWLHQAKTYSSFGNIYNFTNYANSKIYFGNTADLTTDASWGIFGI